MSVYIYGLVDPVTYFIRYVGKTIDIKNRFTFHTKYDKADTHKLRWLNGLKERGVLPDIIILEITSIEMWEDREKYWISFLKQMDEPLTNGTNGGDGREKGFKHPESACKKISNAVKNRSKELRESVAKKVSLKLKGRPLSENNILELKKSHRKYWDNIDKEERVKRTSHLKHKWSLESRTKLSKTTTGKKRGKGTSIYNGVSWFKRDGCWRAWIKIEGKQIHLGYHALELDAARAYNEAIIKYNKPLSCLNKIPE